MGKNKIRQQQRLPSSPPVVSTDYCSKLIPCLSFRRGLPPVRSQQPPQLVLPPANGRCCEELPACRSTPTPTPTPTPTSSSTSSSSHRAEENYERRSFARRVYWEKVRQLEVELLQLSKWLEAEKGLIDSLKVAANCQGSAEGIDMHKLIRLRQFGGGYIRGITQTQRPWERLFLQLSEPGIAEFGSTFWEVVTKMTSVGAQKLDELLRQSIPIANITGSHVEQSKEDHVRAGSESGFMEAILSGAVEKLGRLALEGLRTQMDPNPSKTSSGHETARRRRRENEEDPLVVVVVLMQVRDGMEDYREVGGRMIGLVEASSTGRVGFNVEGLHVAGMGLSASGDGSFMWSGSLKGCGGSVEGCHCCCRFLRNEDVAFASC